ncbi:hypothetical protein J2TS4_02170 [Paenibacillus sp. J2TS4]|nr:hypothetical protein J2TS4_02170 [Paenibacillus sp. J2TS4]
MEFHPEIWHISNFDLTIRIILALLLGGLIGLERVLCKNSRNNKLIVDFPSEAEAISCGLLCCATQAIN